MNVTISEEVAVIGGVETVVYAMALPLDDSETGMVYVDANPADDNRRRALASRVRAAPELLAACRCEADDCMDGDLLSFVAEWLRSHADAVDAAYDNKPAHTEALRDWADRLEHKQALQAAALAKARPEN